MLNTFQYNTNYYNAIPGDYGLITGFLLQYGSYVFPNSKVCISNLPDISDWPAVNFQNYDIAKADGMWNSEYNLKSKVVSLRWWIRGASQADMEEVIVEMKKELYKKYQNLTYKRWDGRILYTPAYVTDLRFERQTHTINYVPFTLSFTTLEPFFYEVHTREEAIQEVSSNLTWSLLYVDGSYEAYPIVYININSATDVDTITLTINNETITLNEDIQSGDFVLFDGRNKDVSINWLLWSDYNGTFPVMPLWETPFSVEINWTREADIYIQRQNTYV